MNTSTTKKTMVAATTTIAATTTPTAATTTTTTNTTTLIPTARPSPSFTRVWSILGRVIDTLVTHGSDMHHHSMMQIMARGVARQQMLDKMGFATPSLNGMKTIRDAVVTAGGSCLGVGSGRHALVETLLSTMTGVTRVVATDDGSWDEKMEKFEPLLPPLTVINMASVTAVNTHPDIDALLLCWAPYGENQMGRDAIVVFRKKMYATKDTARIGRARVIVQGELGGATGTEEMQEELYQHWDEATDSLTWPGGNGLTEHLQVFRLLEGEEDEEEEKSE